MAARLIVLNHGLLISQMIQLKAELYRSSCLCVLFMSVGLTFGATVKRPPTKSTTIEKAVHVSPPPVDGDRYLYIPFLVPVNASRINISYAYDKNDGKNALDIGIFDSRSNDPKRSLFGFRGWSGGRRDNFFIERTLATPGYVAGSLPAGTWNIILGLYRVAAGGVQVSLKITIETETEQTSLRKPPSTSFANRTDPRSMPAGRRASRNLRWVAGDLHLHTLHSDGDWTITDLISAAQMAGLDFLVITDHNTRSHHDEIDRLGKVTGMPLLIRGEEITTYGGHANAWGMPTDSLIDFRVRPGDLKSMAAVATQAHRLGALISINHPFAICPGCSWSYDRQARGFDAIEVWNGTWDQTDEQALAWWDELLQQGRRITAIASSDSHRPANPIGHPATHVAIGFASEMGLLNSIRAGRAYLTGETRGPQIRFEVIKPDGSIRTIGDIVRLKQPTTLHFLITIENIAQGATITLISDGQIVRRFPAESKVKQSFDVHCRRSGYFRLELRDQKGAMLALTNPIYVTIK